jgi:hypothetical protein
MIPHPTAAHRPCDTTAPTARPRIADLARTAVRRLSDRVHATADDQARALGWQITQTPGPLGLTGRRYRDPRFATRTSQPTTGPR